MLNPSKLSDFTSQGEQLELELVEFANTRFVGLGSADRAHQKTGGVMPARLYSRSFLLYSDFEPDCLGNRIVFVVARCCN